MSHGLFDGIGLPLHNDEVNRFVHQHWAELQGFQAPGGWFNALWKDPSGAKIVVNTHESGEIESIPGFAGGPTTRLTGISGVPDSDALVADVVDDDGELVTRLCAAFDQWRFLPQISSEDTFDAIITGPSKRPMSHFTLHG